LNVETGEEPTLKCSQCKDEAHSLKLYNRGEDLVEVFSFDLREALCYEVGSLSTIGLNVKYPTVFNDPVLSRREVSTRQDAMTYLVG